MSDLSKCPICGKPSGPGRARPFCSPRCAQVDLGRWFAGTYAVPAPEGDEEDDGTADGLGVLDPKPGLG